MSSPADDPLSYNIYRQKNGDIWCEIVGYLYMDIYAAINDRGESVKVEILPRLKEHLRPIEESKFILFQYIFRSICYLH